MYGCISREKRSWCKRGHSGASFGGPEVGEGSRWDFFSLFKILIFIYLFGCTSSSCSLGIFQLWHGDLVLTRTGTWPCTGGIESSH